MREEIIKLIEQEKLIAIVRGIEANKCIQLAQALYNGGFKLMEITFNQKQPESWDTTAKAITAVAEKFRGRMEVGAGTVLTPGQVDMAANAGAKFIISPDANSNVIRRSRELGLVSIPGVLSPTEITSAWEAGADFVKLFPVTTLGLPYIKAVRAPLNHIPMMAVGGVNEENLKAYLDAGLCGAGIGGNLVNKAWIEAGEFDKITALAKKMVGIAKGE